MTRLGTSRIYRVLLRVNVVINVDCAHPPFHWLPVLLLVAFVVDGDKVHAWA